MEHASVQNKRTGRQTLGLSDAEALATREDTVSDGAVLGAACDAVPGVEASTMRTGEMKNHIGEGSGLK